MSKNAYFPIPNITSEKNCPPLVPCPHMLRRDKANISLFSSSCGLSNSNSLCSPTSVIGLNVGQFWETNCFFPNMQIDSRAFCYWADRKQDGGLWNFFDHHSFSILNFLYGTRRWINFVVVFTSFQSNLLWENRKKLALPLFY